MQSGTWKYFPVARPLRKSTQIACGVTLLKGASRSSRRQLAAYPDGWKAEHPSIPRSDIAGIGSVLRHDYDEVRLEIIVKLRGAPLDDLRAAVIALLKKYDPESERFIER
jgi:hypothetical protein